MPKTDPIGQLTSSELERLLNAINTLRAHQDILEPELYKSLNIKARQLIAENEERARIEREDREAIKSGDSSDETSS